MELQISDLPAIIAVVGSVITIILAVRKEWADRSSAAGEVSEAVKNVVGPLNDRINALEKEVRRQARQLNRYKRRQAGYGKKWVAFLKRTAGRLSILSEEVEQVMYADMPSEMEHEV